MDSSIEFSEKAGRIKEIEQGTSISEFLSSSYLHTIAQTIEREYYPTGSTRFRYPVHLLLKLLIIKCFRKQSYARTIHLLTDEDCFHLGAELGQDGYIIPNSATLHYFVKYRLGVKGIKRLMHLVGEAILLWAQNEMVGIIDSTPIEASRYDKYAPFHPHYSVKMDKAHIFHLGPYPLAMVYSYGTDADPSHLLPLLKRVKTLNPQLTNVLLDAGYDSFEAHAQVWYHLNARPCIDIREGAVLQNEGNVERIRHWVNKLWRAGGDIHAPLAQQLRFLFQNGRVEQVGMHFRNKNLLDPEFSALMRNRGECERVHGRIKASVTFHLRRIQHESRELYMILNFVAYQLLLLIGLRAGVKNPTHLSGLF
jgi:hypothetical protein